MCNKVGTLVKLEGDTLTFQKIRCHSWLCDQCAPVRRRRLIAQAEAGKPNRFITLTVNPHWFDSPEERAVNLTKAWRLIVAAFRHKWPNVKPEYMCVFEETKRGEPHLHIMWRGPFMPIRWLKAQMIKRMGAPVQDIRLVRSIKEVAKYIHKYISKRPVQFGNLKRAWCSKSYAPKKKGDKIRAITTAIYYWITRRHIIDHMVSCLEQGWTVDVLNPAKMVCQMPWHSTHPPWLWLEEAVSVKLPETPEVSTVPF